MPARIGLGFGLGNRPRPRATPPVFLTRADVLVGLAVLVSVGWIGGESVPPAYGTACAPGQATRTGEAGAASDPLFVFATIADSHITQHPFDDDRYLKARSLASDLLANYVRDINARVPEVDFVVHLGDVTDFGKPSEFAGARAILDSLRCPLYPVVGNHDNFESDDKNAWKAFAGRDSTNYTFDCSGFHFIVIDCTSNPYMPTMADCGGEVRDWVAEDLIANYDKPTILLLHYNMFKREWGATFRPLEGVYREIRGARELREELECAGNVIAVINGHVHANRTEVHDGVYYIDVGATLVGKPSIRYFHVFRDTIDVFCEYISDKRLLGYVSSLCDRCKDCLAAGRTCEFIDGEPIDREFSIPVAIPTCPRLAADGSPLACAIRVEKQGVRLSADILCDLYGPGVVSLHGARGRELCRCETEKLEPRMRIDLNGAMPECVPLATGVYYLRLLVDDRPFVQRFEVE